MGAADPTKENRHDDRSRRDRPRSRRTPHPRPITSSPNSSSTAIAPSRTNPTRDRCPKPVSSLPPSPTSSTPSSRRLSETRLEPDLEDLLWSTVNLFHRANERIERELDDNEQAQKRSQTRPGWLRNPLGRTGASHRRGHDADRATQQHGILPRPGRRALRTSHRIALASAQRLDGEPPRLDLGYDRQSRLPRRQTPGRDRGADCPPGRRSPSPVASTATITA